MDYLKHGLFEINVFGLFVDYLKHELFEIICLWIICFRLFETICSGVVYLWIICCGLFVDYLKH